MKIIIYFLALLVFIVLLTGFLLSPSRDDMSMTTMLSVSMLLALYVVGLSVAGEGKTIDEREIAHRYSANRLALITGTIVLSIGILFQLFTHSLDYWLLAGLIAINLAKIISLIYLNYKN